MNKGKRSFVTATRAAAAPPKETKESSAGNSQHHGSEKSTLSELARIFVMSLPPVESSIATWVERRSSLLILEPKHLDAIVAKVDDVDGAV